MIPFRKSTKDCMSIFPVNDGGMRDGVFVVFIVFSNINLYVAYLLNKLFCWCDLCDVELVTLYRSICVECSMGFGCFYRISMNKCILILEGIVANR